MKHHYISYLIISISILLDSIIARIIFSYLIRKWRIVSKNNISNFLTNILRLHKIVSITIKVVLIITLIRTIVALIITIYMWKSHNLSDILYLWMAPIVLFSLTLSLLILKPVFTILQKNINIDYPKKGDDVK